MTIAGPDGLQRIPPALPVKAMRSFTMSAPLATHFRRGTCEEAGCPGWEPGCGWCDLGWEMQVDERTDLGLAQATYIRQGSGRAFREMKAGNGLTVFRFEGHQKCFRADHEPHDHRVPNGRPERFTERSGDWRGNPDGQFREHVRPDDWVDSFANNQDRLNTAFERG